MKRKIAFAIILFILASIIIGCSDSRIDKWKENRIRAKSICDNRNGELVHYGLIININDGSNHYESVCFKSDEQHFYYDLIE